MTPMPDTLFVNARLVDPATGLDAPGSLLVSRGVIASAVGIAAMRI